jgi:hypothetical protein
MRSWLTRPDHDAQLDALSQPPTIRFVLTRVPPLWVFAGLVALQVLYVLTFDPFITVDAAAHIGSSAQLVDMIRETGYDARELLEWHPFPAPNVLATFVLSALLWLSGIEWGERFFLLGYLVAFPASLLFALRAGRRANADLLAFFALPLTFTFTFLYGFLNYSYSIVLFLVIAGVALRLPERPSVWHSIGLGVLLCATYLTHLVGFLESALLVVLIACTVVLFEHRLVRPQARHLMIALGPSAALALWFVASSESADATAWENPLRKLAGIVSLEWALASYDRLEWVFCVILAGTLWALGAVALRRALNEKARDPVAIALLGFVTGSFVLAIFSPEAVESGGSFLSQRLALFPALGGLLWLSRQRLTGRELGAAAIFAVVAAVGLIAARDTELRELERIARDLAPVTACFPRGQTVVQADLARPYAGSLDRLRPLTAETGRLTAPTDSLDLGNIDWAVPFSVLHYKAAVNPYVHLVDEGGFVEEVPPPLDFERYERRTGVPVEAVLVFGRPRADPATLASARHQAFDAQLRDMFERVQISPGGWWEAWLRKPQTGRRC